MRPYQWELSALVMIERRRRPPLIDVALRALRNSILCGKLRPVRIRVTTLAIGRRALELNLVRIRQRFVTFVTSHTAMASHQGKLGFRMIERADIDPRFGAVASLAPERGSVGPLLCHARVEFAVVRIGMARGARTVLEVEWQNLVGPASEARLVTFGAGHGHMRSRERKARVLVLGDRERRSVKILYGVAILAAVLIRSGGELLVMRILMAIRASREFHFVDRVLPRRRVAFLASDGHMFPFERIL